MAARTAISAPGTAAIAFASGAAEAGGMGSGSAASSIGSSSAGSASVGVAALSKDVQADMTAPSCGAASASMPTSSAAKRIPSAVSATGMPPGVIAAMAGSIGAAGGRIASIVG
jgi:hypothetical protein